MNISRREVKPSVHLQLRDYLSVLAKLFDTLVHTGTSPHALKAAVEATREGAGADLAFWHPKNGGKPVAMCGFTRMKPEKCASFARKLLAAIPHDREISRWANPERSRENHPSAALIARTARSSGCIVALSFASGRHFDRSDEAVARMALKMLAGMQAHAQAATKQLLSSVINNLSSILDAKDPYTAGHSERVARIAVLVGQQLGLSPPMVSDLFLAGILHDLGQVGVRDELLWKPAPLTPQEFDEVKRHPLIGEKLVASIEPLRRLSPAVRHHHEHYDGTGYPDRLAGEAIPILSRVLAVADAVDAMMSPRRHRPARSPAEIDEIFENESGKQFDPAIVAAFMAVRTQIYLLNYQERLGGSEADVIAQF